LNFFNPYDEVSDVLKVYEVLDVLEVGSIFRLLLLRKEKNVLLCVFVTSCYKKFLFLPRFRGSSYQKLSILNQEIKKKTNKIE
jgi:hypothetical protein